MSADNVVIMKRKPDGIYWGDFSMSAEFHGEKHKDSDFSQGPFKTGREAIDNAKKELSVIEYGFEWEEE